MAKKSAANKVVERENVAVPSNVLMLASTLNPAPYNPRKITPTKLEALKQNIRRHGFLQAIVVQKSSEEFGPNVIIGGHQRLRAVREICVEDGTPTPKLPCVVLDVDDRAAKKLNVGLNKIEGEFDTRLLSELMDSLNEDVKLDTEEIRAMGFEDEEVSKLIKLMDPPQIEIDNEPDGFARSVTLGLEFNDLRMRDGMKKMLAERAQAEKKKTGEIVFEAMGGKLP